MSLETVTNIADLVPTNPTAADPKSQGDDHIRNLKTAMKNAFAGFTGSVIVSGVDGGAVNAYTLTPANALPAYGLKMIAVFAPTVANTGAATLNISGLGVKALTSVSGAVLAAGDLSVGTIYSAFYDGTQFRLLSITKNYVDQLAFASALPAQALGFLRSSGTTAAFTTTHTGYAVDEVKGADIASAATINLTTATGNLVHVTGAVTITAIMIPVGAERTVVFDGALKITNGAGLLLPGGADITTSAGDRMIVRGDTSGANVISYSYADGRSVNMILRIAVITSSQSWAVPAPNFEVELQAAGAGGHNGGGSGGGAGGYVKKAFYGATVGATAMIVLGAKGMGAAGNANSSAGVPTSGTSAQASSFTLSGFTTLNAGGGVNGVSGLGGAATGGDLNIPGQKGVTGNYRSDGQSGGCGGNSQLGYSNYYVEGAAPVPSGYGAGGGSGSHIYNGPGVYNDSAGADGGPAICIIRW